MAAYRGVPAILVTLKVSIETVVSTRIKIPILLIKYAKILLTKTELKKKLIFFDSILSLKFMKY